MGPTPHEIPGGYHLTTKTGISPHVEVPGAETFVRFRCGAPTQSIAA